MDNKKLLEAEIKSLEMYKKDLEKIRKRVSTKREKEVLKLEARIKEIEEISEYELQALYGHDVISKKEYEHRLDEIREYEKNKNTFKDTPTGLSLYLKLLDNEIKDCNSNILLDKEELENL